MVARAAQIRHLLMQGVASFVDGHAGPACARYPSEAAMAGVDDLWCFPARNVEADGLPDLVNGDTGVDGRARDSGEAGFALYREEVRPAVLGEGDGLVNTLARCADGLDGH